MSAMDRAVAATVPSVERSDADARLGVVAYLGGVVGITGLVTLGLMYAIEVPTGGPYRFGAANDIGGAVFAGLLIPLVIGLEGRLPLGRASRALASATIAASAAGVVLPILLITGRLAFEIETPLVVGVFVVQSLWLIGAGRRMRRLAWVPSRLARFSQVVGGTFIAGLAIAGPSLLLPWGSVPQLVIGGLGIALAVIGWIGWPIWFVAIGRALRRGVGG